MPPPRHAALLAATLLGLLFAPTTHADTSAPASLDGVPAALRSPRATMQTFLEAIVDAHETSNPRRIQDAARCLDLSALPPSIRADAASELAIKLKEVIDRIRYVDFDTIPDTPEGPPYIFHREPDLDTHIAIHRVPDGRWLFSAATVARIPDLYAHFEAADRVAGVIGTNLALSPALWLRAQMPPELRGTWLLMEHWQWLLLLAIIALGWLLGRLVRATLRGPVRALLARRDWFVPHRLIERLLSPLSLVAMGLIWLIGLRYLGLSPDVAAVAVVIFKFLSAFGVIRVAMRAIDLITHVLAERAKLTPSKFDDLAVPFFNKTAKVVVVAVGILFMADVFGVSPTSLFAGIGLGGLAVALAAQDTVKNLFGSFTLILDRPFEVGDGIQIGKDLAGTVEEVGFRSTRIRSWDNTLITIPNGNLISANVENLGNRTFFRLRTTLNLAYDTPPTQVEAFCRAIEELIRQHPDSRKQAFYCRFSGFGAHSLDLMISCHFTVRDMTSFINARHSLLLAILTLAARMKVAFAYPTQTLHLLRGGDIPEAPPTPIADLAAYDAAARAAIDEATRIALATQAEDPTRADD